MEQNLFGNKKVLVTGASGLLGAHTVMSLLSHGVSVRAMVRNENSKHKAESFFALYPELNLNFELLEWQFADVTLYNQVEPVLQDIAYVFHCAGFVSFNDNDSQELFEINVEGTSNVLEASKVHNIEKFCFVSSVAAIGKPKHSNVITEECDYELKSNRSAYGYSKYLAEMEVWRAIAEDLPSIIVNPSVIIGPGQWNQSSGKLFTTVAKGLKYYTTGITGYIGVHDVVNCMIQLMQSNIVNERFIVSSENIDYKTMFSNIAVGIGKTAPSKQATPFLMKLAAAFFSVLSLFTGKSSQINAKTVVTAFSKSYYSNKKISEALKYTFEPISKVIEKTSSYFPKQ